MLLQLHLLFACCFQLFWEWSHARGLPQPLRDRPTLSSGYDSANEAFENLTLSVLQPRQDDGSGVLNCLPSCDLDTCSTCNPSVLASKRALTERDFDIASAWGLPVKQDSLPLASGQLEKRIFRLDGSGAVYLNPAAEDDPATEDEYTIGRVAPYLVNQIVTNGKRGWDKQYGNLDGFFSVQQDERAVSNERTFGTQPFQWGTNGLHGCTMVTVVSKRAVWMAHFWESYSNGKPNRDTVPDAVFQQRVLNALTGDPVSSPTNPPAGTNFYPTGKNAKGEDIEYKGIWKNYIPPSGPGLNPALYNRDTDNTMIYIMTPAKDGQDTGSKIQKYPNRIRSIVTTINRHLAQPRGSRNPPVFYNYRRLEIPGADEAEKDTNERGMCLFQYDPHADGANLRQWRLFYEGSVTGGEV